MNPAEFAEVVVLPTVKEHLAAPGVRRLAYLACITTYSLVDYVARAEAGAGASTADAKKSAIEVGRHNRSVFPFAFQVVQGVANGTKHSVATGPFAFKPGSETFEAEFIWSSASPGFQHRGGRGSGLWVNHAGVPLYIDECVQAVLATMMKGYARHFSTVDVSWLHPQFSYLPVPPA